MSVRVYQCACAYAARYSREFVYPFGATWPKASGYCMSE